MRIPSGTTDQVIYFVAVDSADKTTRKTGLFSFTVYRDRNGAGVTAMTTPTITEVDSTNMPGVYKLLLDEDMVIGTGNDTEEMIFHITQASMEPVTRVIELYRPKITIGNTLSVESDGDLTKVNTLDGHTVQTGDSYSIISSGTYGLSALKTLIDTIDIMIDSIFEYTGTTLPATLSSIDGKIDTVDGIVDSIIIDTAEIGIAGAGLTEAGGTGNQFTELPNVILANGAHGGSSASITLSSYSDFTGEAAANPNVLQDGTITVTSQTEFILSSGSTDDDAYNNMVIVFENSATATQKSVRTITDYIGSTKTVIIDSVPDFTIANTDNFSILAVAPGSTPPTVGQIRTEIDSNSTQLASLVSRITSARAGYLDKLNVSGTLAHSDAAATYQTDITDLTTLMGTVNSEVSSIKEDTTALLIDPTTQAAVDAVVSSSQNDIEAAIAALEIPLAATIADEVLSQILPDVSAEALVAGQDISVKMALRAAFNRFYREVIQTATIQSVKNDSGVVIASMNVSDDGVTQTKGSA